MFSKYQIKHAILNTQRSMLIRMISVLVLCLLLVELVVGAIFFYDLYRSEVKIMTSMATEYQRILTYDSVDQLIHVMTHNPQRLIDNNIAVYIQSPSSASGQFVAGDQSIPSDLNFANLQYQSHSWLNTFMLNSFMSTKLSGDDVAFWLVLNNQARYPIALNQWYLTFIALIILVLITTLLVYRIIRKTMSPLITLDDLLDKFHQGELEASNVLAPTTDSKLQGLDLIHLNVHHAMARLVHINTTLNTTVDAIAHDVKTPLTRITLAAQSALLEQKDINQLNNALADCAEYAGQANHMLSALMTLNDEVTGKLQQKNVTTNLSEVVNNVVNWFEDIADEKDIQLKSIHQDVMIESSPEKLTQILVNLVDNALKFTPAGGAVSLIIEKPRIIEKPSLQSINILVKDTGIGIDEQHQQLVFEKLYRVDSSRSNVEGYGLGLSLASAMVKNLGGTLSLQSQKDQGSTFIVSLPIDKQAN